MTQPFNDQGWGLVDLHWQQRLKQGRVTILAGAADVTDYVDVHGLTDLWIQFSNLAFRVSPPIAVPSGVPSALRPARWLPTTYTWWLALLMTTLTRPTQKKALTPKFLNARPV